MLDRHKTLNTTMTTINPSYTSRLRLQNIVLIQNCRSPQLYPNVHTVHTRSHVLFHQGKSSYRSFIIDIILIPLSFQRRKQWEQWKQFHHKNCLLNTMQFSHACFSKATTGDMRMDNFPGEDNTGN